MPFRWNPREHLALGIYVLKWTLILLPVSAAIGSACALFLWSLDLATQTRWHYPWLLFFLPLAGLFSGWIYHWLGKSVEAGNNLIVEQIHEPGGGIPARMAPLVLIGTLATHLFGGSAGREGTAVQMGGSMASTYGRLFHFNSNEIRILLMAGIAAGFGAVFGTPLTGAIFALEVLAIGRLSYEALLPCLVASIAADWTCAAWGIHHTQYKVAISELPHLDALLLAKAALAGIAFGFASLLFAECAHGFAFFYKKIRFPPLRPAAGAFIVIGLVYLLDTRDYLGIGVTTPNGAGVSIVSSFTSGGATPFSWLWKIVFTCVTISSGFKGGEVTPLFFVGASLGNILAQFMGAPVDLFAALGFVAVFAGAANTPLACTLMGVELFGPEYAVYFAVACFLSYSFSGHSGIYLSQRIGASKACFSRAAEDATLRDVRLKQPAAHEVFWNAKSALKLRPRKRHDRG